MPSPAFDKLKQALNSTITTAFAVGDRAYRTVGPFVRKTAQEVHTRVTKNDTAPAPAPQAGPPAPEPRPEPGDGPVSPATVAKNIAHQRPVVTPVAQATPDPEDSPGGKLPPRR